MARNKKKLVKALDKIQSTVERLKNCGAGAPGSPGFQPGNSCAGGGGGGSAMGRLRAAGVPVTVEAAAAEAGLTLSDSSYDKGAKIVKDTRLSSVAASLEQAGWRESGGYESSTGRSIGFVHSKDPDGIVHMTIAEPKARKYREGTFIDMSVYIL